MKQGSQSQVGSAPTNSSPLPPGGGRSAAAALATPLPLPWPAEAAAAAHPADQVPAGVVFHKVAEPAVGALLLILEPQADVKIAHGRVATAAASR